MTEIEKLKETLFLTGLALADALDFVKALQENKEQLALENAKKVWIRKIEDINIILNNPENFIVY